MTRGLAAPEKILKKCLENETDFSSCFIRSHDLLGVELVSMGGNV